MNAANPAQLYKAYRDRREAFYKELARTRPALQVFLEGWLNRIRSFDEINATGAGGLPF